VVAGNVLFGGVSGQKSYGEPRGGSKEKSWSFAMDAGYHCKMKSAYELAMERLNKNAPAVKLTAKQKQELAELDSRYAAKVAEREIALNGEIAKAADDLEKADALRNQLVRERKKIQAELEEKKDQVRAGR
jgi:hypothetical protein